VVSGSSVGCFPLYCSRIVSATRYGWMVGFFWFVLLGFQVGFAFFCGVLSVASLPRYSIRERPIFPYQRALTDKLFLGEVFPVQLFPLGPPKVKITQGGGAVRAGQKLLG